MSLKILQKFHICFDFLKGHEDDINGLGLLEIESINDYVIFLSKNGNCYISRL
jgi:hypothetical protein